MIVIAMLTILAILAAAALLVLDLLRALRAAVASRLGAWGLTLVVLAAVLLAVSGDGDSHAPRHAPAPSATSSR